jgi:hypothetical protein
MNTKVKTRDGRDAIIIDINGPSPEWPIAAWVWHGNGKYYLCAYTALGYMSSGTPCGTDLMLTTYKYRVEFRDGNVGPWNRGFGSDFSGLKVSRGTFDMDGNLIDICLLTEAQIKELRVTC